MNTDALNLILWGPQYVLASTRHPQAAWNYSDQRVTVAFQDHALMNKIYKGDLSEILSSVLTKVK